MNLISIPMVSSFPFSDWNAVRETMANGLRFSLGQPWLSQLETDFVPGEVHLGFNDESLLFYTRLQDDLPSNGATGPNQRMWELGDVAELFLQADGASDYYEFHVTPENQRLQLHFPPERALRSSRSIEPWTVEQPLFESFTHIDSSGGSWEALLRIHLSSLFGVRPARLRFLAGRYDLQSRQSRTVISCTGNLSACDFHKPSQWSVAEVRRRELEG